ncbi:VCBS repeat-containing protein, partial [Candidatus Woesearchaeota archaeon]|nr:VCBS repeat-containing protein [Candidatus Woesearchaeota archaeon]
MALKKGWWLLILLLLVPLSLAVNDEYKPYLHKPSIPSNPAPKLYGSYSTNLFPGAATYSYPIEVLKGTNGLQPSLTISYNSQSVKQRPSILGAGWSLTQNYIYRNVNFTPSNVSDDFFVLVLNGANYDLIYDKKDLFYHTETETFARIENLTGAPNGLGTYWLVTLKDGTQLRFGYNSDSELISNLYPYASKWSLDLIQDTFGNSIAYSYLENPHIQDSGAVYLSEIKYNNDEKRKIIFSYESSARPDRRISYENGNKADESRRMSGIFVLFEGKLVRRYIFSYKSLNDEGSLSSLSGIAYIGSDNASVLHNMSFGYYKSDSVYRNSSKYVAPVAFSDATNDFGLRLADLNNDGYIDLIQSRQATSEKKVWLNGHSNWTEASSFSPPEYFTDGSNLDKGLRLADVNNDGFPDLLLGYGTSKSAWLNNGTGWHRDIAWDPPIAFVSAGVDGGVQLADFNGDGRVDILQAKEGAAKKAYLNKGNGWKDASSDWIMPSYFVKSDGSDYGARLSDINGDGLVDVAEGYNFGTETRKAWLNNGTGWVSYDSYAPPTVFTSSARVDEGARLADLNGDGLEDIIVDFANSTEIMRGAWINYGRGWVSRSAWKSPEPFTLNGKNIGRRIADVNGDGIGDIIVAYNEGSNQYRHVVLRNSTLPYMLANITNEFGGITRIDYTQSTEFNNTGEDGIGDIGFNVWVVDNIIQDNNLFSNINNSNSSNKNYKFNINAVTNYSYWGGSYNYNDSEFRGFNIVNET